MLNVQVYFNYFIPTLIQLELCIGGGKSITDRALHLQILYRNSHREHYC